MEIKFFRKQQGIIALSAQLCNNAYGPMVY